MNRPAVFFDRDNTLIACDGYLGDPEKVVLVEGAADAIARVRDLGFAAVVFSNQSGVARGMFPEEAVHAVNHRLDDLLHEENPRATIDRHDFCPYHPSAKIERYRIDSDLRKPKPGMIYQAASVLGLDLARSWVVGDAPRDIAAGQAAGLRTVLLKMPSLPPSPATNEGAGASPDFVAGSLTQAIDFIAGNADPSGSALAMQDQGEAGRAEGAVGGEAISDQETDLSSVDEATSQPADAWTSPRSHRTSESLIPSTARAEEPVKLTPRPKSTEPIKPAASKPESSNPEGAKQGGFVVKPNQPAPIGITWGERMRLAKEGPISSAAASARPEVPKQETLRPPDGPAAMPEPTTPDPTAAEPETLEEAEMPEAKVAAPEASADLGARASSPAGARPDDVAADPEGEVTHAEMPGVPEKWPAAASPAATADDVETASGELARDELETAGDEAPAAGDAPVSFDAPADEPRRGVRREELLKHAYDLPSDPDDVPPAAARRRRDAASEGRTDARGDAPVGDLSRVEALLEQVVAELRRRDDLSAGDFSASKLVAGITQVLALAALFYAYFNKDSTTWLVPTLLVAIALQTLTISLLIMGRQK